MSNKKSQYTFQTKVREYRGANHPAANTGYREMPRVVKFMATSLIVLYVVACAITFAASLVGGS